MAKITTAQMIVQNEIRFASAQIRDTKKHDAQLAAARLCSPANKEYFQKEAARLAATGSTMPWWAIAIIKEREAGSDPAFQRNISCGQPWSKKTTIVPKGRGPFKDWYSAADDALIICGPNAAHWHDWSAGGAMTIFIRYNGLGYDNKGLPSPYAYGGTTAYIKGKYVSDGKFDPNFVDPQLGCAALLKAMMAIDPSVQLQGAGANPPRKTPTPPKPVVDDKIKKTSAVRKAAGGVTVAAGAGEGTTQAAGTPPPMGHGVLWGVIGAGVAVVVIVTFIIINQKKKLLEAWN